MTEQIEEIEPVLKLADPLVAPTYSVVAYPASKIPDAYKALVFSRWLNSLRHGNSLFGDVPSDIYYKQYHAFLENLMSKPDSIARFAVLTDEPDVVLGFSVSREDVVDYVHVHKDQRRVGIGKSLLPAKITAMTHITKTGMLIWRMNPKYKHLIFNPFA